MADIYLDTWSPKLTLSIQIAPPTHACPMRACYSLLRETHWSISGQLARSTKLGSDILQNRFTQNFTYQQSPLIIFREDSGLIPLAEAGADESFLNDLIQTIATERAILQSLTDQTRENDITGAVITSDSRSGIFGWLEKKWEIEIGRAHV